MTRARTTGCRALRAALLALGIAAATATAAGIDDVDALYAADASVREHARRAWLEGSAGDLSPLDPRRSPCLGASPLPPLCRQHAAFLGAAVDILARVSARETAAAAARHPARDLLWALLSDPAVDAFDGPALDPDRGRALRRQAERALRAAMSLPTAPTLASAAAASVARTADTHHQWFMLQSCAGDTQYSGCRYGSYLFDTRGRLIASGTIEIGAADNPGAGIDDWRLALLPASGAQRRGVAFTRGGFGGDIDRVELRQLAPRLRALCGLKLPRLPGGPDAAELMQAVDHQSGACTWKTLPAGATPLDHLRPSTRAASPTTPSLPAPVPR